MRNAIKMLIKPENQIHQYSLFKLVLTVW